MAETNTTVTETNKAENGSTGAYGGDPTQAVKGGANLPEKAVSTSEPEQTAKTFTQAELDAIVKQRLERQAKGQPSKEEMEAFRKWQDSQKTAEQLSQEKISAAESGRAEAEKKLAAAEAKCCAYSKGVTAEAVDDVIALAMAKVSDDMPIEKAIDAVISKYPSFCSAKSAPQGVTTGVSFGNGGKQPSGVEAAFLAKNPNIKI
jgi:hypothetical protein